MKNTFFLFVIFAVACQTPSGQKATEAQSRDPNVAQMKKVMIKNAAQKDSLINAGVELIVIEDNYVIAKIAPDAMGTLASKGLETSDAEEADFVRRLIAVTDWHKSDLTHFAEMGLDIWEVKNDTVVAQAFDKYIRQLQNEGFTVEVIEKNALDIIEKRN